LATTPGVPSGDAAILSGSHLRLATACHALGVSLFGTGGAEPQSNETTAIEAQFAAMVPADNAHALKVVDQLLKARAASQPRTASGRVWWLSELNDCMSALNDTVAATLSVCRHLAQHQVLQASDTLNKVCRSKATTSLTSAPAGVSNAVVSPRRLGKVSTREIRRTTAQFQAACRNLALLTDVDGVIDVPHRRASHDHASPRHTEPLAQFGSVPTAHTLDMAVARFCVLVQEYCEALRKNHNSDDVVNMFSDRLNEANAAVNDATLNIFRVQYDAIRQSSDGVGESDVVGGSSDDAFAVEPDSSAHLSAVARSVAELCDLHADAGRAALQLKRAAMLAVAMVDGDIDEFVSTIDDDDDDDDYNGNAGEQADARDSVATASSRVVARSTPSYLVALLHTRQPKLAASNRLVNALALVSITVAAHLARLRADSNVFGRTAVVNAATLHARAAFRALLPLRTSWCSTMVWSYDSARADDVRNERKSFEKQAAVCFAQYARLLPILEIIN